MPRLKFNFQTKILIPVMGVLVLFFVVTMCLLNWRIKSQLRSEAGESLTIAQAVFKNSLQLRAQNLQAEFMPVCNQSSFISVVVKNDPETLQFSLKQMLETI